MTNDWKRAMNISTNINIKIKKKKFLKKKAGSTHLNFQNLLRPAKFVIWQRQIWAFWMRNLLPDCKSGRTENYVVVQRSIRNRFLLNYYVVLWDRVFLFFPELRCAYSGLSTLKSYRTFLAHKINNPDPKTNFQTQNCRKLPKTTCKNSVTAISPISYWNTPTSSVNICISYHSELTKMGKR